MTQLDYPSRVSAAPQTVAPNVYRIPTGISNAYFVALDADEYVLIDAGGKPHGGRILRRAQQLFGAAKPRAILLTHGHFDHAGGLPRILESWGDVPVYAHAMELPYLNHGMRYPPGDPTVGGLMAEMSRFLKTSRPTRVQKEVLPLPEEVMELEFMRGWEIRPTPGHTPGHVSFWHPTSRILIAGDAISTVDQKSAVGTLMQRPEIAPPPQYATYNWSHARQSARTLAELEPYFICAGHGVPMFGEQIAKELREFAEHFPVPARGRYVSTPARFGKHGPTFIPPPVADYTKRVAIGAGIVLGAAAAGYYLSRRNRR